MTQAHLTQNELRKLFDYQPLTGLLTRKTCTARKHTSGELVGCPSGHGYLRTQIHSKKYYVHRLIWCWMTGEWPKHDIDHINHDRADNSWSNLRSVTRGENLHNAKPHPRNTSGHAGVTWCKRTGKWKAQISKDGRLKNIGYFDDLATAALARQNAKSLYHPTAPHHV